MLISFLLLQKAQSELAYDLQASVTKQKIKEEEMEIKVVERAQQINVQQQVRADSPNWSTSNTMTDRERIVN